MVFLRSQRNRPSRSSAAFRRRQTLPGYGREFHINGIHEFVNVRSGVVGDEETRHPVEPSIKISLRTGCHWDSPLMVSSKFEEDVSFRTIILSQVGAPMPQRRSAVRWYLAELAAAPSDQSMKRLPQRAGRVTHCK